MAVSLSSVTRKVALAFFLLASSLVFINYALQVWFRLAASDWSTQVSEGDEGMYTVEYSYVAENWILLRLYKTGGSVLLAERTYQYIDYAKFIWVDNMLIYDTSDESFYYQGHVSLPPTRLDRLLALFP